MLENLRAFGDRLVRPIARLLLALRVAPDVVTWLGTVAVCVTALITVPQGWLWQGALIIGVLSLSDTIDGAMARLDDRVGRWGAFLDSSLDRVADGAIFGSVVIFFALRGEQAWAVLALAVLVTGQLISYLKARAESLGGTGGGGPAARADRIVIILLGMLAHGLSLPWALPAALVVLAVLGGWTVALRMRRAARSLAE